MNLIEEINKLKGERASLVKESRAILEKAQKEKRNLSADETKRYEDMHTDIESKGQEIERLESQHRIETDLRNERDSDYRAGLDNPNEKKKTGRASEAYKNALFGKGGYARVGKNGLGEKHLNALQEGTDSEGGYLVPEEFETAIVRILSNGNPLRAAATVITTASDRNIPIEASTGSFAYIDEEAAYGESDPSVGRVVLGAHKAGGIIKVSEELLQDAFFDIGSWLMDLAGRRYADLEDTNFAAGDGSGKPTGIFATSTVGGVTGVSITGTTGAVSATAVITTDDLIDTYHGLKRAYRERASWVFGDTMAKMVRKLKDANDQYMWQPGLVAGQPDTLLSRPVIISDGATAPAPDAKSIMFGDLSQYYIVDRLGMAMQRLNELYAANGQVGFKFTRRHDGKIVNAEAFTFFQHGAAS